MNETELIVRQALNIEELKEENKILKEIIRRINGELFSIGAPLNDNIDGYTNRQLQVFLRIDKILRGEF